MSKAKMMVGTDGKKEQTAESSNKGIKGPREGMKVGNKGIIQERREDRTQGQKDERHKEGKTESSKDVHKVGQSLYIMEQ